MTTITNLQNTTASKKSLVDSLSFDRLFAFLSFWFVGGIFLDGWAHHNLDGLETFFTPWHGVLYSGFLITAVTLIIRVVQNKRELGSWQTAVPIGYGYSLIGAILFAAGGGGDMLWHELFGIELSVDALLSPTHLLLAAGGILIITGPLRAAWQRVTTKPSWSAIWPTILTASLTLSLLTFFTQYAHPLVIAYADAAAAGEHGLNIVNFIDAENAQSLGIVAVLLQTAFLMGILLLLLRRWQWQLPFGSMTLFMTLNGLGMSVLDNGYRFIPALLIAGLVADGWLWWKRPLTISAKRLFTFVVPATIYALYFITIALTSTLWWNIHLWAGTIFIAGIAGLLLSFAFIPPVSPNQPQSKA